MIYTDERYIFAHMYAILAIDYYNKNGYIVIFKMTYSLTYTFGKIRLVLIFFYYFCPGKLPLIKN